MASISVTERANQWLAANYKMFSRQQYFDRFVGLQQDSLYHVCTFSNGMFISLAYSAPVLINCVGILVGLGEEAGGMILLCQINWFFVSGDLLVSVKRRELLERDKEAKKTQ